LDAILGLRPDVGRPDFDIPGVDVRDILRRGEELPVAEGGRPIIPPSTARSDRLPLRRGEEPLPVVEEPTRVERTPEGSTASSDRLPTRKGEYPSRLDTLRDILPEIDMPERGEGLPFVDLPRRAKDLPVVEGPERTYPDFTIRRTQAPADVVQEPTLLERARQALPDVEMPDVSLPSADPRELPRIIAELIADEEGLPVVEGPRRLPTQAAPYLGDEGFAAPPETGPFAQFNDLVPAEQPSWWDRFRDFDVPGGRPTADFLPDGRPTADFLPKNLDFGMPTADFLKPGSRDYSSFEDMMQARGSELPVDYGSPTDIIDALVKSGGQTITDARDALTGVKNSLLPPRASLPPGQQLGPRTAGYTEVDKNTISIEGMDGQFSVRRGQSDGLQYVFDESGAAVGMVDPSTGRVVLTGDEAEFDKVAQAIEAQQPLGTYPDPGTPGTLIPQPTAPTPAASGVAAAAPVVPIATGGGRTNTTGSGASGVRGGGETRGQSATPSGRSSRREYSSQANGRNYTPSTSRTRGRRKSRTSGGGFWEGFPFNRPDSPIRQQILALLNDEFAGMRSGDRGGGKKKKQRT